MNEFTDSTTDSPDQPAPAWTRRRFITVLGKMALASGAVLLGIGAHRAEADCNPQQSCMSCGCPPGNTYGNPYCCYSGDYVFVITPCYLDGGLYFNCYSVCQQQVCAYEPTR